MMRIAKLMIVPALLMLSGGFCDLAAQNGEAAAPDTVVMEGSPVGTVTFSHAEHQAMADCVACHHESKSEKPLETRYQQCGECHVDEPQPPMETSRRDAFHDRRGQTGLCITCHKEESDSGDPEPPVQCNACHVRNRG